MTAGSFTCANCGQTFEKGRSDEEAMAESAAEFGAHEPEDLCVVCDDCYRALVTMTDRILSEVVINPLKTWINDLAATGAVYDGKRSGLFNAADLPGHKRNRWRR